MASCYASLLQKQPDSPEYQYGLAASLAGMGEAPAAAGLMHRLAPGDAVGYPLVHLYLAEGLLRGPSATPETLRSAECQEKWDQAAPYLEAALPGMPEDRAIHAALAQTYEKIGKPEKAAAHRRFLQSPATSTAPSPVK